jgi:DNA polymerase III delta prime subunit
MTLLPNNSWFRKYAPRTVDELIATPRVKAMINNILETRTIPDMILVGAPGIGKTTIARLMCNLLEADYLFIPASMKGNIDTLRTDIQAFASARSFTGQRKYVILDEADGLTTATQPAMRNFIDTYAGNCGFILTANYGSKLIGPLLERLETHELEILPAELPQMLMSFAKRSKEILTLESVPFEPSIVNQFVADKAPNWRGILRDLQKYASAHGAIDAGILQQTSEKALEELIPLIRGKKFPEIRAWIAVNAPTSGSELLSQVVTVLEPIITTVSLAPVIVTVADYQYKAAFVADQQINLSAALAEIMMTAQFNA